MFKKAIAISTLALASGVAMADTQDFAVQVSADIPTADFYVTTTPDWNAGEVQQMGWDEGNARLSALQRNLLAKSTIGPITGYLLSAPQMQTADGSNAIDLAVRVNNVTLPVGAGSAPTLITQVDAANERAYPLRIEQSSTDRPAPGRYNGTVSMVFESVAP